MKTRHNSLKLPKFLGVLNHKGTAELTALYPLRINEIGVQKVDVNYVMFNQSQLSFVSGLSCNHDFNFTRWDVPNLLTDKKSSLTLENPEKFHLAADLSNHHYKGCAEQKGETTIDSVIIVSTEELRKGDFLNPSNLFYQLALPKLELFNAQFEKVKGMYGDFSRQGF